MRTSVAVLTLLALTARPGGAGEVDRAKLRETIRLPVVSMQVGILFDEHGIVLPGRDQDLSEEIAATREALKGDDSDAERYSRLGYLYGKKKDEEKARESYKKAVELYRRRVKADPGNGRLLGRLGQALNDVGQQEEAEALLRRAVRTAPGEWSCWLALGQHLMGAACKALLVGELADRGRKVAPQQWLELAARGLITGANADRAEKLLDESMACLDRAVREGPREVDTHFQRATIRFLQGSMRAAIAIVRRGAPSVAGLMPPECLADLRQAARLSRDNPELVGMAVLYEFLFACVQKKVVQIQDKKKLWEALPAEFRAHVRESTAALARAGESRDRKVAVRAGEVRGLVSFFIGYDMPGAEAATRRSIELDPSREQAWTMLQATLLEQGKTRELTEVCVRHLKYADTPHNRLLLAKAYQDLHRMKQAEEVLKSSLARDPDDPLTNLGLAAALMKRGDDAATLGQAAKLLDRAESLLARSPGKDADGNYPLLRGLHLALTGNVDQALSVLRDTAARRPKDDRPRKVLDILGR